MLLTYVNRQFPYNYDVQQIFLTFAMSHDVSPGSLVPEVIVSKDGWMDVGVSKFQFRKGESRIKQISDHPMNISVKWRRLVLLFPNIKFNSKKGISYIDLPGYLITIPLRFLPISTVPYISSFSPTLYLLSHRESTYSTPLEIPFLLLASVDYLFVIYLTYIPCLPILILIPCPYPQPQSFLPSVSRQIRNEG